MRRFTAEYLEQTRRGMWEDSQAALAALRLDEAKTVLDVGAGTGELTRILRENSPGQVLSLDADRSLLSQTETPRLLGDATRLPVADSVVEVVVCQALLVNLPTPAAALDEFVRVAQSRVGAIEPDNSAVTVESTVPAEPALMASARRRYLCGVQTDPTFGDGRELFEHAGLDAITVQRYDHHQSIEPPYSDTAFEAVRRKATGAGLKTRRETMLAGNTTAEQFDQLREAWRAMGRTAVEQMRNQEYCYSETVPFYVTVGHV
ncbi:MAG: methylase involved in ubiquinone/menaquinone biosynthesis [halophilic archaeon J07HX5]|nr:MAG: methylase involved in ubiquinone/menaquinone biosynthesis [halophilic archaeon J07HX5]